MENKTDRSFVDMASVGFRSLWRFRAKALNHHASLGYMKVQALSYSSFVVEVPGIEPGSFGIKTGLLRA